MKFMNTLSWRNVPLWTWLASLLAAIVLFLSLDLARERPVYELHIAPAAGYSAPLKVVFYGNRTNALRWQNAISVPKSGWKESRASDSVTFTAATDAPPMVIRAVDESIQLAFLSYPQSSAAILSDGAQYKNEIKLDSATESIVPLVVGGENSVVPSIGMHAVYGLPARMGIFALIFLATSAIAVRLMTASAAPLVTKPKRSETLWLAFPLALSTTATQLSFYPTNAGYDASAQWVQAAIGGMLSEPLGYPATFLMRLFAWIDTSPAPLIALQGILAALGVALVLRQLRYRGVPTWCAVAAVLILSLTPQYPLFFTNLGKDALSAVAVLYFSWALLAAFRTQRGTPVPKFIWISLVCSALMAGIMRSNVMPVIMVAMLCVLFLLYHRSAARDAVVAGATFLMLAIAIPSGLSMLAKAEIRAHLPQSFVGDLENPPFLFGYFHIYHLFGAAVASGVPIDAEDSALFYRLAPREAWAQFDCQMVDTTQIAITHNMLLDQKEYGLFLRNHLPDLAKAIARILWAHPGVLLDRQTCITRMFWHTAVGQRPVQTTATVGYDSPDSGFLTLAGQNQSLFPKLTGAIKRYMQETEAASWFWLFWKPALPLFAGLFIVFMFVARTRDPGVLMATVTPIASILLLAMVMPFPAYRYAYPAVLMMMLLSTLAFARPREHATDA